MPSYSARKPAYFPIFIGFLRIFLDFQNNKKIIFVKLFCCKSLELFYFNGFSDYVILVPDFLH